MDRRVFIKYWHCVLLAANIDKRGRYFIWVFIDWARYNPDSWLSDAGENMQIPTTFNNHQTLADWIIEYWDLPAHN